MFTYGIAAAVNEGWLPERYIVIALNGWEGIKTTITENGTVQGTCIGTGINSAMKHYYTRPTLDDDVHGLGPVIMAGVEIEKYLVKRDFKCLLKKSIIWANYLIPSIYLEGKVKIIRDVNHRNIKLEIQVPEIFKDIILKPGPDEITKAEFMTPTQISEKLKLLGLHSNPMNIGKYMKKLGFQRKAKKIAGLGTIYGYYVIIRNSV